ncbi:hypothetical protein DFH06DRAFT_1147270 [Mycena polygramma]|nr:hypothetical protein DFH06DRAFT_1147270 [Mycena polygramma]
MTSKDPASASTLADDVDSTVERPPSMLQSVVARHSPFSLVSRRYMRTATPASPPRRRPSAHPLAPRTQQPTSMAARPGKVPEATTPRRGLMSTRVSVSRLRRRTLGVPRGQERHLIQRDGEGGVRSSHRDVWTLAPGSNVQAFMGEESTQRAMDLEEGPQRAGLVARVVLGIDLEAPVGEPAEHVREGCGVVSVSTTSPWSSRTTIEIEWKGLAVMRIEIEPGGDLRYGHEKIEGEGGGMGYGFALDTMSGACVLGRRMCSFGDDTSIGAESVAQILFIRWTRKSRPFAKLARCAGVAPDYNESRGESGDCLCGVAGLQHSVGPEIGVETKLGVKARALCPRSSEAG